ncbi:unnamed protein product [Cylicocyclus nassatus]|uniref:Protein dct-5 n=1 Tax=Cylicocyclus nassatus TaxID=53992 RepID=A0AA36MF25_CYLNA|nr:unnamed protein product [Cylicocyclus nassatus]
MTASSQIRSNAVAVTVLAFAMTTVQGASPCASLSQCAVQKCLDKDMVRRVVANSTRSQLFGALVEKFDMVCIAAKCTDQCRACDQCQYAIEQMSALASGEQTSGLCPKLETCVQGCLTAGEVRQILSCVADQCNVHCYDGDCPSCRAMSKRIFTLICQQTGMTKLAHIKYPGPCPLLFNDLADEYVAVKRRVAA